MMPGGGTAGYRHPFIVGTYFLGGVGDNPRTLADLAMSQFSWFIRSQPNWWQSHQNQSVREQWSEKAVDRNWMVTTPSSTATVHLSDKQIAYVLDELAGYALLRDEVSCFERIWESNQILDATALATLNEAFDKLKKDKTFSSDGTTKVIVDPTHCPLVYDRSLVSLPSHSPLRTIPPPRLTDIYTLSQRFALLPVDIFVSPSGDVEFLTYINDLNPQLHLSIYQLIQRTLTSFIPLFEHTLTDLHRNNPLKQRIPGACRYTVWDEPDPPEHSDDEEGWVAYERDMREWTLNRPISLPDISTGYRGGMEQRRQTVTLNSKRLQCIVSVSEHQMIPGTTELLGTPWHVEGMKNERVVACGFFFTAVENIQSCDLQFRMAVSYPRGFHAGDSGATLRTWGLRDGDSCHQYIGSVPIRDGFGVVFPNIYQHRYTPITLSDPSKTGNFTVLSFGLVDPDIPSIISTANVGPQQKSWIRKALDEYVDVRLPIEIVEKIVDMVEGVMDDQESQAYSEKLREERINFWKLNDNYHFCIPFDIWNGPEIIQ
ncbi:hypothetical protein BDP27DRAFT_1424833 [Rhodocollybia butyracea]|uniref:DUF4246 domain-containing protein n=1 Tax=Rhodocollybia butyracea TaxID=206335 RepID=A0A9P5PMT5_9AGAR|nr:hypothetical protein BDP27DRAFT_1424833 [Rhodocollybia butyracea]